MRNAPLVDGALRRATVGKNVPASVTHTAYNRNDDAAVTP
jgi:hypothetical protein